MNYEQQILHWVNRLGFLTRKEIVARFGAAGFEVSPEEWALLLLLNEGGAKAPSEIAEITSKDRTTVTRLVDGMVCKGLVSRIPNEADRRRMVIELSASGHSLFAKLAPIAKGLIGDALGGIGEDDAQITLAVLKRMTSNLQGADLSSSSKKETQDAKL